MRKIGDLIDKAQELKERGMRIGEIADELNVSRQTADWLVSHAGEEEEGGVAAPEDLFVDWSPVGSDAAMLRDISSALTHLVDDEPDAVVGVAMSGLPLSTEVASNLESSLAVFHPKKRHWEPGSEEVKGAISSNFLDPEGLSVVIVDDIVTTGTTASEAVSALEAKGCEVQAVVVLVDKSGQDYVEEVPLKALMRVGRVS